MNCSYACLVEDEFVRLKMIMVVHGGRGGWGGGSGVAREGKEG